MSHKYTYQDPVSRCALRVARYVHNHGRVTRSSVRRTLSHPERVHWPAALATILATAMVREDGRHHLIPGSRPPDPFAEDSPPHCRTCTCQDSDAPLDSSS
jgi:hypothetical protein